MAKWYETIAFYMVPELLRLVKSHERRYGTHPSARESRMITEAFGNIEGHLNYLTSGCFNAVYTYDDNSAIFKVPKDLLYLRYPPYEQLALENGIFESCNVPSPKTIVKPTLGGKTGILGAQFVDGFQPLTLHALMDNENYQEQLRNLFLLNDLIVDTFGCSIDPIDLESGTAYAKNIGKPLSWLLKKGEQLPNFVISQNIGTRNDELTVIDQGMLWLKDNDHINKKLVPFHQQCYAAGKYFLVDPMRRYITG